MMKKTTLLLILLVAAAATLTAGELSLERQRQIIERYMYVTGQLAELPTSLSSGEAGLTLPTKCGTPAIIEYQRNRDRLDRQLMISLGVEDATRLVRQAQYGVPGGHTLIHYDLTGRNSVWQATVDANSNGVPDYVEALARIADSSYVFIVDSLGYPAPLSDTGCVDGGDGRVDIYIDSLPAGLYGLTHNQTECYEPTYQHEAGWVVIDRDFQQLPSYKGRPLDAARVTLAHELFHTVHFALDATEHVSWFEMSAVWMEEQIYDDLNDYYLYDYIFFEKPWLSIHDTTDVFHLYIAALFPMFVTEKLDRDIVRAVWERAADLGPGSQFLEAFDFVIDSASTDPAYAKYDCNCYLQDTTNCLDSTLIVENLATYLNEFAVWNFFTGPYAEMAPEGIGYSEAAFYDHIPNERMRVFYNYPSSVLPASGDRLFPQPNGTMYVRFDNLQMIDFDTLLTLWLDHDSLWAGTDSLADVKWGVSAIFQYADNLDSHRVVSEIVDDWETVVCTTMTDTGCVKYGTFPGRFLDEILGEWVCLDGEFGSNLPCGLSNCNDSTRAIDLREYRSLTLAITPVTTDPGSIESEPPLYPYTNGRGAVGLTILAFDSTFVDQELVELQAELLTPYPNPAVVSEMGNQPLVFRFRVPTDSTSFQVSTIVTLKVDLFSVSGELVRSIVMEYDGDTRNGPDPGGAVEATWDMKNQSGKDVASGVYLAVGRLTYVDETGASLEHVDQTKVAVIR